MLTVHRVLGTWQNGVDAYVTPTRFARDKFVAGGLPADKIHVKPNFVDPDPGALEDAKVLGDGLNRNRKRLREFVDGRLAGGEPLEDRPPRRIPQRGEGRAQLVNHMVE